MTVAAPPAAGAGFDWAGAHRRLAALNSLLAPAAEPDDRQVREVLRRRARLLAEPLAPAATGGVEFLAFAVGAARFAVPLDAAEAVAAADGIVEVPCTPPAIRGVFNHRGEVVAVIDLCAYFELPAAEAAASRGRIVICAAGGARLGFLAEAGVEAVRVEAGQIVPAASLLIGDEAGSLGGLAPDNLVLLDLERFGNDPRIAVNDDGD